MNSIAKTLNVLRGALSRWILPYDNNTRIDSQCSTPHSVVENMPEEFRGKLTERQVRSEWGVYMWCMLSCVQCDFVLCVVIIIRCYATK